jgi:hypothetical protein
MLSVRSMLKPPLMMIQALPNCKAHQFPKRADCVSFIIGFQRSVNAVMRH